jgi:cyclophilin family peptidyl-prolyl cis-trans isomerase
MVLDEGEIVIALDPAAAPDTIRTILGLAKPEPQPDGEARGYYDGLALDFTWPHIEIGTGVRSGEAFLIPQEIDAASLGLDSEKITDEKTAMNLWQFEFGEANNRWKTEGHRPEQFVEWLGIFNETNSVDFLMDVSIEEINEVLGYRYVTDLQSLRARRGSVYLKPLSTVDNSPALRILLTDRPQLDGRVTVVGRVVKGLDLAERLSVCELKTFRNREIYEPVDPAVIRRMEVIELPGSIPTSVAPDGDRSSTVRLDDGRSTGAGSATSQPPEEVEPEGGVR